MHCKFQLLIEEGNSTNDERLHNLVLQIIYIHLLKLKLKLLMSFIFVTLHAWKVFMARYSSPEVVVQARAHCSPTTCITVQLCGSWNVFCSVFVALKLYQSVLSYLLWKPLGLCSAFILWRYDFHEVTECLNSDGGKHYTDVLCTWKRWDLSPVVVCLAMPSIVVQMARDFGCFWSPYARL